MKTYKQAKTLLYFVLFVLAITFYFLADNIIPVFYSIIYWMIAVPFVGYVYRKCDDFLHPAIPLVILLYLYSIASMLYYYKNDFMTQHGAAISGWSIFLFCSSCVFGLLGIVGGAYIAFRRNPVPFRIGFAKQILARWAVPCLLFFAAVLGAVYYENIRQDFNFLSAKSYSETALSSRVAVLEGDATMPVLQVITRVVPLGMVVAGSIILLFRGNLLTRILGGALVFSNILALVASGSRGGLFAVVAAVAIFFNYRVYKLRLVTVLGGILLCVLVLNAIGIARSTSQFSEMRDRLLYETGGSVTSLLDLGSSGELLVGMNLMKLIEALSTSETEYNYGKGFVDDVLCYIPRALYSNRPLPSSERFLEEFYPGVRDSGGGYGSFFLQDGYWALGVLGVFLSLVVYTWVVSMIYLRIKPHFDCDFITLLYAFAYFPLVVSSPRSGLVLSFKEAATSTAALFLVIPIAVVTYGLIKEKQRLGSVTGV